MKFYIVVEKQRAFYDGVLQEESTARESVDGVLVLLSFTGEAPRALIAHGGPLQLMTEGEAALLMETPQWKRSSIDHRMPKAPRKARLWPWILAAASVAAGSAYYFL